MTLMTMTPVDAWPTRRDPQERFDEMVQNAMNQMSEMVTQLNNVLIPALNEVGVDEFPAIRTSVGELQTKATELSGKITEIETALSGKASNTVMTGASTSAAGQTGLVPPPSSGNADRYLRSDGTWVIPPNDNTVYTVATTANDGLLKQLSNNASQFLNGQGNWVVPPNDNTTYNNATSTVSGLMSNTDKAKLDGIQAGAQVNPTDISGNAGTANKLTTARSIQTNLSSTAGANFDGSGNITPGVTGTLGLGNGGTGSTSASGALTNLGGIAKSGDRGQLSGSEQASTVTGSQTITISSPDCININTSGAVTLTFTAAAENVRSVKAICLKATATTTLEVSGAVWANKGTQPTWGNVNTILVLLAHFVGGRVVLTTADNTQ